MDLVDLNGKIEEGVVVGFRGLRSLDQTFLSNRTHEIENAKTVGELLVATEKAKEEFERTGLFASVDVELSSPHEGAEVNFDLTESKSQFSMGTSANQNGQVSMETSATLPCLAGRPMIGNLNFASSGKNCWNLMASIKRPLALEAFGRRFEGCILASKSDTDHFVPSSFAESQRGLQLNLADELGRHSVSLNCFLRDICPKWDSGRIASSEISNSQLRSAKDSVRYEYRKTRTAHDQDGASCLVAAEAAGLFGDAKFVKFELASTVQKSVPTLPVSFILRGAFGLLHPLTANKSFLSDRYFLGGASGGHSALTGFASRGVGPSVPRPHQSQVDCLGGDVLLSGGVWANYSFQWPNVPRWNAFVTIGGGFLLSAVRDLASRDVPKCASVASAIGVRIPIGVGAAECSLAIPLTSNSNAKCFQFGYRSMLSDII